MPIPYKHKRSTEAGVAPTTLQDGEIAINVAAADPKIFYKDSASTIRAFSLASYASATHSHVVADVTDFTTKANVVSVNGITGVVSISHTSVSAAAASHTHAASDVVSGTFDIARIPTVSYTALSNVPTSFTPSAHTHVAADVVNLTSVANVVSVNGITGSVILTNASVSAASAVHSHVAADISNFTSVANVVSVNAKTGVVSISHTDVTAASASHTHAASDVTSGTFDAARLPLATTGAAGAVIVGTGLGVSSGTVSVTYGTSSTSACRGDDSRLSDARTPTSHSHGNITNAGAIGSTSGLPVITTTSGVLTTGTFSTSAGTFCEGNDSRLSDTRTPTDGSVTTAKIANDAVTYAKLQNVSATDRLLGRSSSGAGDVEEITCTSFGRSLIDDADAAAARTTLSVQPTASPAFTGAATFNNTGNVVPLTVTNTGTANSFVVNDASGDPTPFVIDASGNVGIKATSTASSLNVVGNSAFYQDANGTPSLGSKSFYAATFENFSAGYGLGIGGVSGATGACIVQVQSFTTSVAYDLLIQPLGGKVGIGTTTPGGTLEVAGGQLLVTAGSGTGPSSYKPGLAVSGDDDSGLQQVGGANTISIVTAGTERVRVDASGRVGIGVTPASAGSSAMQVRGDLDIFGNGSDRSITYNVGVGDDGITGWYRSKIAFIPSGAANNISQHISFFNKDGDNGGSTLTERMRIANDGKIYGYSVYATTVGATNRDLFIDSGGLIGYVSSIRASKTNIESIDDVSWLRNLTPVSFHYRRRNEDGTYSDEPDGTLDYGLIAEDVEPVAPEMCFYDVVDGEPQLRGVHYSKLITPMLRYIQQLEARIAALEERLNHA